MVEGGVAALTFARAGERAGYSRAFLLLWAVSPISPELADVTPPALALAPS